MGLTLLSQSTVHTTFKALDYVDCFTDALTKLTPSRLLQVL
jgi:hypothetical protein